MLNFEIFILIVTILRFFYCALYTIKVERTQNLISIDLLVSEILIFKLILICKFENVPCSLGIKVKHFKKSVEVSGHVQ